MKRSEFLQWLLDKDDVGCTNLDPDIVITDGQHDYTILSVYSDESDNVKTPTIYIDLQVKE